jgi:protein-L-isoaspartate(D-aspartate) O-methyltransferase
MSGKPPPAGNRERRFPARIEPAPALVARKPAPTLGPSPAAINAPKRTAATQAPAPAAAAQSAAATNTQLAGFDHEQAPARQRMVQQLQARGYGNAAIWQAMSRVPRHRFIDAALASQAYEDTALPIGFEQTISSPSIVATMLAAIGLGQMQAPRRVLDVGTGCGYQAAVISLLCVEVYSIERIRGLHEKAIVNLRELRLPNLHLIHADATHLPESYGMFDAIVSAASAAAVPPVWYARLNVGGVLVTPVGEDDQRLLRVVRVGSGSTPLDYRQEFLEVVRFVPLQSGRK